MGNVVGRDFEPDVQEIDCRLVSSPQGLSKLLKDIFGEGRFQVEMRHNIYSIRAPRQLGLVSLYNIVKVQQQLTRTE